MASEVITSYGRLMGGEERGLHVFRGVPFAAPPVGRRRFRAPERPARWDGVRDATRFGPVCPQPRPMQGRASVFAGMFGPGQLEMDEDSLTLNIWTPGVDDGRRPVMVWIHGGGFRMGTGASPMYDGGNLARRGDVVVVSVNYRLGALGFLYLPELGGANFGTLDQIAALAWVREEIAAFGGDPENVTIFGESAGGKSVETLLAAPRARGLFRRAIAQSTYAPPMDGASALSAAEELLERLGVPRNEAAERLRDLPAEQIVDAQAAMAEAAMASGGSAVTRGGFSPVVDGDVLPVHPVDAVAAGSAREVDLIVGTNLDESRLFGAMMPGVAPADEAALVQRVAGLLPGAEDWEGLARRAVQAYRESRTARGEGASPADIWFAISTDRTFRYHSTRLAAAQARNGAGTYMYLFTWASPAFDGALGSCHALEIPFVFGNLEGPLAELAGVGPEARALSAKVQDAWLAFARTGRPDHDGLPAWLRYDGAERRTMVLGRQCAVVSAPQEPERRLWEEAGV
jgi:para-nitrobenzyl esterase